MAVGDREKDLVEMLAKSRAALESLTETTLSQMDPTGRAYFVLAESLEKRGKALENFLSGQGSQFTKEVQRKLVDVLKDAQGANLKQLKNQKQRLQNIRQVFEQQKTQLTQEEKDVLSANIQDIESQIQTDIQKKGSIIGRGQEFLKKRGVDTASILAGVAGNNPILAVLGRSIGDFIETQIEERKRQADERREETQELLNILKQENEELIEKLKDIRDDETLDEILKTQERLRASSEELVDIQKQSEKFQRQRRTLEAKEERQGRLKAAKGGLGGIGQFFLDPKTFMSGLIKGLGGLLGKFLGIKGVLLAGLGFILMGLFKFLRNNWEEIKTDFRDIFLNQLPVKLASALGGIVSSLAGATGRLAINTITGGRYGSFSRGVSAASDFTQRWLGGGRALELEAARTPEERERARKQKEALGRFIPSAVPSFGERGNTISKTQIVDHNGAEIGNKILEQSNSTTDILKTINETTQEQLREAKKEKEELSEWGRIIQQLLIRFDSTATTSIEDMISRRTQTQRLRGESFSQRRGRQKTEAMDRSRISKGSDGSLTDIVYRSLVAAETGSLGQMDVDDPRRFIRTRADTKSSAFGPAQITMGLMRSFLEKNRDTLSDEEIEFAERFIQQGKRFLSSPAQDPVYGLGGTGDIIQSDKDKELYERLAKKLVSQTLESSGQDPLSAAREWRYGYSQARAGARDPAHERRFSAAYESFMQENLERERGITLLNERSENMTMAPNNIIVNNVGAGMGGGTSAGFGLTGTGGAGPSAIGATRNPEPILYSAIRQSYTFTEE
jgi:hypothetical protein